MKTVLIRDRKGKPVPAELIRKLRIKGFERCNLALVKAKDLQITVTELSTGSQLGWSWVGANKPEEEAILSAKEKLTKHGLKGFEAAVKLTIEKFGGEVLNA